MIANDKRKNNKKKYNTGIMEDYSNLFNIEIDENEDNIEELDFTDELNVSSLDEHNYLHEELINVNAADYGDDSLKYYLDEISKYKLLTHDDEIELSKQIEKNDEKALQKLINSNLRLVVKIAKHYVSVDYPLIDIIQDGNLGLIKAAKKYDFRKNVRFSTYASWWIKQTIIRSLSLRRRMIRVPHRKEEKLRKIKRAASNYYQTNKKIPSSQELSSILQMESEEINKILNATNSVVSFENTFNDESCSIKNIISDDTYKPDDLFVKELMKNEAHKLLESLVPKERFILSCRFGFTGEKYTLKKMGNYFGISAETVRQIEIKALKKLKIKYAYLQEFLN